LLALSNATDFKLGDTDIIDAKLKQDIKTESEISTSVLSSFDETSLTSTTGTKKSQGYFFHSIIITFRVSYKY
jgi:hypothetical protein